MTLDNLLGLSLEAVQPDAASIARLLEAAQCSLADAHQFRSLISDQLRLTRVMAAPVEVVA